MKKVIESVWQTGIRPRWINILECGHKYYAKYGDADAKYATKRKCKECDKKVQQTNKQPIEKD